MKKQFFLRAWLFLLATSLMGLPCRSQDHLLSSYFLHVTGEGGNAGRTAMLTLNLENISPVSSWDCELILPEGISFGSVSAVRERWPEGYEADITTSTGESGSVTICCKGTEGIGIAGTNGPVAVVEVSVPKGTLSGLYTVTLQKMHFHCAEGNSHFKDYTEFKWPIMGGSVPFVEEGKVWQYNVSGVRPDGDIWTWDETYSLEGDTAIGSFLCKKLYFSSTDPYPCDHRYKGALYQTGRKIYYIAPDSTTSILLYDFYSAPGETIEVGSYKYGGRNEYFITKKSLVIYRGKYLTVTEWDQREPFGDRYYREGGLPPVHYEDMAWIEGVGNRRDLLNEYSEWNTGGGVPRLEKCTLNGEVLYDRVDFRKNASVVTEEQTSQPYFTAGTKWTEIRLDTLKHQSWYSKAGGEWVPNFETVEYHVKQDVYDGWYSVSNYTNLGYVYTNGPEWSDSLAFRIAENHSDGDIHISPQVLLYDDFFSIGEAYQFQWSAGRELYCLQARLDGISYPDIEYVKNSYGTIDEIREGDFGGVRPLRYVDLNGTRIIQGIGVAQWNDGECLFGPVNLYRYSVYPQTPPERHYRSMLVHFERDGEVLYDVWPEKGTVGIECPDSLTPAPSPGRREIYDLQGHQLMREPEHGIYIKDGKKIAVK